MSKIRIVSTRTTGTTHLTADQSDETLSSLVARQHPVSTLCGRKVEGTRGYFDAEHDGTVQFGTRGDCVRCTTRGRARGILPAAHDYTVPLGAGSPPFCSCGVVGGNGVNRPLLADHLREVGHPDFPPTIPRPGGPTPKIPGVRRNDDRRYAELLNDPMGDEDGPDPADREPDESSGPSPDQERAWDLREDDLRGHAL